MKIGSSAPSRSACVSLDGGDAPGGDLSKIEKFIHVEGSET